MSIWNVRSAALVAYFGLAALCLVAFVIANASHALTYAEGRDLVEEKTDDSFGYGSPSRAKEPQNAGWSIYLDQDLLIGFMELNEDRNYTMGIGASLRGKRVDSSWNFLNTAMEHINSVWAPNRGMDGEIFNSFSFGVTAFTPRDLRARTAVIGDRPYSSLLYLETSRQWLDSPQGKKNLYFLVDEVVETKLTFGVLGLELGEKFQAEVHRHFAQNRIPEGWEHQISDGGEPTVKYQYQKRKLIPSLATFELGKGKSYDVSYRYKVEAGYYTGAAAGIDFRYGKIRSGFWHHDGNPMSSANKNESFRGGSFLDHQDSYFWLSSTVNLVVYTLCFKDSSQTTTMSSVLQRLIAW